MIDKTRFYEKFRPFYKAKRGVKALPSSIVEDIDFLLDEFDNSLDWHNNREIAYALATIAHETAWTFEPIMEYRARAGTAGRRNQDRYWLSGFQGRGYVQLTWKANYLKAGKEIGVDLVKNPNLAMEPDIAFKILTKGMHQGWFTGKKLSDYINGSKTDYKGARKIINGTDKNVLIASYATAFEKMLEYATEEEEDFRNKFVNKTGDSKPINFSEVDEEVIYEEPDVVEENVEDEETGRTEEQQTASDETETPDGAKPGEPAPDDAAKEGEAVVGGRPDDPPKEVEAVEPKETTGWGAWVANVRAQWAALGIGLPALGSLSFFTNPIFIYTALGLVAVAIVVSITVYLTSMYLKNKEKREREQRAHELTLEQMRLAADPTKYNVKVIKE